MCRGAHGVLARASLSGRNKSLLDLPCNPSMSGFGPDQLDVSQVNFYELDNGFNTAQCTRAVAEPLLFLSFVVVSPFECGVVLIFVFGTTLFDFPSCCGILQFILKDLHQTIADSINDLCVNVADPEA
ncbi:hypothetical protein TSUD_211640 [Trifolium subterraneum]|uniref:Uncharacterized protein n=1 Tax=Trifolium subterraneum TaxID=3900 RepID=A0A2Z6NJB3_TRISU|nr:hypothetical protein TSUD_211640 [Trifolium subterraneum]